MAGKAQKRIIELRTQLDHHNYLYHVEAQPVISDQKYDELMNELIALEQENPDLQSPDSPSQRVGGAPIDAFRTVEHAVRMMSIDNTYSAEDLHAFDERVRKGLDGAQPLYVLEPKVDGVAVSLRYEAGKLVLAATRGDGRRGDDITHNIRTIRGIPLVLREKKVPPIFEVRGEIFMPDAEFQRINKKREADGEMLFVNPRNSTAGTLKQLDPKITAARKLRFVAHGLGQVEPEICDSYWDCLKEIKRFGMPIGEHLSRAKNIDEAIEFIDAFAKLRGKLAYQTDGMVVKVDSLAQRRKLGETNKAPRWVIAYKYPAERVQTIIREVDWQVGKAGTLTPVARMDPVFVAGTTVRNASLHNIEQIERLDIHINDTIVLEKAGEIIPYIVEAVPEKRPKGAKKITPPKKCPSCGSAVEKEVDTPYIRCVNPACPAQLKERLRWFAARGQMDIDGLGERIIDQLVEQDALKTYADLFRLRIDQIADLAREVEVGDKIAKKIVDAIKVAGARREEPILHKPAVQGTADLVAAIRDMKIDSLGEKTIEQLIAHGLVNSLHDLFTLRSEQLSALTREVKVGKKTAEKILESIANAKPRGLSRVLSGLGVRHVGTTVGRQLAQSFHDVKAIMKATEPEIRAALSKDGGPSKQDQAVAECEELAAALQSDGTRGIIASLKNDDSEILSDTARFLTAHGRELKLGVSEKRIARLAEFFPEVTQLLKATQGELVECLQEEKAIAKSVFEFFQSTAGRRVIEDLEGVGVKLSEARTVSIGQLEGQTWVVTGTLERFSRTKIQEFLRKMGANVTDSVTTKTTRLLYGENAGSKFQKAKDIEIRVTSEAEFMREFRKEIEEFLAAG